MLKCLASSFSEQMNKASRKHHDLLEDNTSLAAQAQTNNISCMENLAPELASPPAR